MRSVAVALLGAFLSFANVEAATAAVATGQFIVVEARRDPAITNAQAQYRPDDPQLVNRIISLIGSTASYDVSRIACARASETTTRMTAGKLFRQLVPERHKLRYSRFARPSDFGVSIAPDTVLAVTRFHCLTPAGRHSSEWDRASLFPIGKGTWALSLIDDFLLILKPVSGRVTASFNCAKATSQTERTICSDPVLAGWDRSVERALIESSGDPEEQRAWLVERDKCGADRSCLRNTMALRVTNLR